MMDPYPQKMDIEIDRPKLEQYIKIWEILLLIALNIILFLTLGILYLGIGIISSIIYLVTVGDWLIRKRVEGYEYQVDGNYIRIKKGIFFKSERVVPLDKIKGFVRYQGPLMKYLNIGGIVMKKDESVTASVEDQMIIDMKENTMIGLKESQKMIDTLSEIREIRSKKE